MTPKRPALGIGLGVLLALAAPAGAEPSRVTVVATPIRALMSDGRVRVGHLEYRGGLVLAADNKDFGGISGLTIDARGENFLALTDRGHWLRGRIVSNGDAPTGLADVVIAPILGSDGRPLADQSRGDTESLARTPDGYAIGIERKQEIWSFKGDDPLDVKGQRIASGGPLAKLGYNEGIEALAWLPGKVGAAKGGVLVAVAEKSPSNENALPGYIVTGGKLAPFTIVRHPDFDATDIALAPDGSVYLLERRFTWATGVGMRVRRFPASDIKPGAKIDGEIIFTADRTAQIDNMEALAIHVNAAGETILTVISDDNFSSIQRTLLLRFAVVGAEN
ncbi:hypothetical protein G3545_22555 [Starkeya sp. ORNL1]|uniref:esterase-like activity of phytase family protein n=1 Tax=Starkeya sp. ORNL1 TaxID=2709380 RepID=UPI00146409DB|nr:esterase-like activity of phytase family protein [Starkeya sp. ORNL1]QJP16184.1 hypothetical protein G3545_22555 [Starkeya sp. ORNL1]